MIFIFKFEVTLAADDDQYLNKFEALTFKVFEILNKWVQNIKIWYKLKIKTEYSNSFCVFF